MQKIKIRIIKIISINNYSTLFEPFSIHGNLIDESLKDPRKSTMFAFNRKAIYR